MKTKTCAYCEGSGYKENDLDGGFYHCPRCGSHGETPVSGSSWFYRSREGRRGPEIAHIHPDRETPDLFIIDYYDERGPSRKSIEPAATAFYELRYFKHAPQTTPRLLDYWSSRPAWSDGLKSLEIVALFNLLSINSLWKEACEATGETKEETLTNLRALKAKHLPNEYTF